MTGAVPVAWRLIAWLIALPLAFLLVFGFAQMIDVLSGNQLEDVFLESGWDRFWPVARLLPFVALVTAGLVQSSVLAMSRLRTRHAVRRFAPPRHDRTDVREPVRPAS